MENKSKYEEFRDSQKPDGFNKYPPVEKYISSSKECDLKRIEISRKFMPHSEMPGNDR